MGKGLLFGKMAVIAFLCNKFGYDRFVFFSFSISRVHSLLFLVYGIEFSEKLESLAHVLLCPPTSLCPVLVFQDVILCAHMLWSILLA